MPIIRTAYLGPTNTQGGRVKARTVTGRSVVLNWDYGLNVEANHKAAAEALVDQLGNDWRGTYTMAQDEGGGYVLISHGMNDVQLGGEG